MIFRRTHYFVYFLLSMALWTAWSVVMLYQPEISTTESYSRGIARIAALLIPSALFLWFNPEFRKEGNLIRSILVGGLLALALYLVHRFTHMIPVEARLPTAAAIWLNWVIGSPFAEEVFFRGIVLRQELKTRSAWLSIPISATCFMLFHLPSWIIVQQQPMLELAINSLSIFVYGLVFGVIYWLARSIWTTFIPHSANNLIALLINPL
ncbi:MAG: CPBP family intramembrane metalloprotease [Flavobacteriales bacterium]|nr:CPBP family intramembrane metalloprotease [Flavobacteriales bacterium]